MSFYCSRKLFHYFCSPSLKKLCPGGGIGRRVGFKTQCLGVRVRFPPRVQKTECETKRQRSFHSVFFILFPHTLCTSIPTQTTSSNPSSFPLEHKKSIHSTFFHSTCRMLYNNQKT